jgi:hypothetical protein
MEKKKKDKLDGPWPPIVEPYIWVQNQLSKKVYVVIVPNEDYVLAEILLGFANIGSSALGIVKTASDLVLVLRTLSLLKNAKEVIDKLNGVLPKSSITIHPHQEAEVYNAYLKDPLMWTKPTGIAALFGGSTLTMIITDEDFKNTVKFNTRLDSRYVVNETGVSPPMHYWNGGHVVTGLLSSASPSLIRMTKNGTNEMLMAYKHSAGTRIFLAEFINGRWRNQGRGYISADTRQALGVTSMKENLCLVGRDFNGDQMWSLWQKDRQVPWDAPCTWMGADIEGKPSATTVGDTTYIVAKHFPGNAVMWAIRHSDGRTERGNTMLNTAYSPSIHAYKGKLYLFLTRMDTLQMCVAASDDGRKWKEVRNDLPRTSAGVALTIYKERLYVIYRDGSGNGVFYMWTTDGSQFEHPEHRYFGFDVHSEPTASPMPDDRGILIAGILTAEWRFADPTNFPNSEAIIWTILMPEEPKPRLKLAGAAKKAAKTRSAKKSSKKAGSRKPAKAK